MRLKIELRVKGKKTPRFVFPVPYPVLGELFSTSDLLKAYKNSKHVFIYLLTYLFVYFSHFWSRERDLKSGESFALETIIFVENC